MARGNDAEQALHELADKFGQGVGNAEEMIQGALRARSRAFMQAELLPRNEEKTAEAREHLDKLKAPRGCTVVDAAVRGDLTTIVYEDPTGRLQLGVNDADGKLVEPDEPPAQSDSAPAKSDKS